MSKKRSTSPAERRKIAAFQDQFTRFFSLGGEARIQLALDILWHVALKWNEDDIVSYPKNMPSFDEFLTNLASKLHEIRWDRTNVKPSPAPTLQMFRDREQKHQFAKDWGLNLFHAQFPFYEFRKNPRIRCGDEQSMSHLIPDSGTLCHDCGCAIGEYHVSNCDAEECPDCRLQLLGCDCPDDQLYLR